MTNEQRAFLLQSLRERFPHIETDPATRFNLYGGLTPAEVAIKEWITELDSESRCICGEPRPCEHIDSMDPFAVEKLHHARRQILQLHNLISPIISEDIHAQLGAVLKSIESVIQATEAANLKAYRSEQG